MTQPPQSTTVALTFDDGPHPDSTPALLDLLAAGGHTATFFVLGEQAARHPELLRAVHRAGMPIGNHSYRHPHLTGLGADALAEEIHRTQRTVADLTGAAPVLFRPPYGETDSRVGAAAAAAGLTEVLWTIDTRDWADTDAEAIVEAAAAARPGDVVLLHDGRPATVAALPRILADLRARGLTSGPIADRPVQGEPVRGNGVRAGLGPGGAAPRTGIAGPGANGGGAG